MKDGNMFDEKECDLEIVAGTYEEFLLGYSLRLVDGEYKLEQTFADHSHKASIRAVAMCGNRLASGGADEIIHLYDLTSRREKGELVQHTGTVTSLAFTPDGAFLLTGSEDGSLNVFRVATWFLEKTWHKAHKGESVNALSIHPTGKLALTVGNDKVLRTWNLVKGRHAYATNIARKSRRPEGIFWSTDGKYYVLPYDTHLDIYSVGTATIIHSLELKSKISCVVFLQDDIVCLGGWDGTVEAYKCKSGKQLWTLNTGQSRVKALAVFNPSSKLITATSEGVLSVYNSLSSPPELLTSIETFCRITCLVAGDPREIVPKKEKIEEIKENNLSRREERKEDDEETVVITPKKRKKSKSKSEDCSTGEVYCSPKGQKWKVDVIE